MLLVTGASGLLGAALVAHAHDLGRQVVGLCHHHKLRMKNVPVHSVDLTSRTATRELIARLRPSSIVHCAAATNVDWCEDHPLETEEANVHASSFLAEVAAEMKCSLTYISTDSVFDGTRGNYSEDDQPSPLNVYAKSKLRGEQEVLRLHPSALVARVTIFGWNAQDKHSVGEWILQELCAGREVRGFTDVHFSPILTNDLAEVLLLMLDRQLTGIFHVVGSERISKYQFAKRLAIIFGFDAEQIVPAELAEATLRAARPLDVSLNTQKVGLALGRVLPNVDQGLRRFRALQQNGYPQQLKSYLTGASQ
jgi:dTDP-4-dehydrorhamnose reductase